MQEAIQTQNISAFEANDSELTKKSSLKKFFNWCNTQQENQFFWLGVSIFGLIGAVAPLTLLAVYFFADNNFTLWVIVCSVNVPVLALNLAAQPLKITIPTLLLSLIVDASVIVASFIMLIVR
jgi:hypothetical protein